MIFDTPVIRLLTILQTQVGDTSHRRSLAPGKGLVNLVDAIRNMVVSLVEQITSTEGRQHMR